MGWPTLISVYFIIWWITIFMVLPFGVQRQTDGIVGQDSGAPQKPRILLKLGINTVLASIIWLGVFIVDRLDLVTLRDVGLQ
jgi:predicted secreted protein